MFIPMAFWNVAPLVCNGPVIPLTSLGAYYKFDSNSLDSSGLTPLNGTNINSPTYAAGYFNEAISLNGTNQSVEVNDSPRLEGSGNNTISVFGWVKANAGGVLVAKMNSGNNAGYQLFFNASSIGVSIGNTGHSRSPGVDIGDWTFIGFTYKATNIGGQGVKIYKNGVQVGSNSGVGNRILGNANKLRIGVNTFGTSGFLNGLIDDLHFWRRELTATEIATLYTSGCPLNT